MAQSTIFLVRHAEKAKSRSIDAKDPSLTNAGRARAKSLSTTLKDANLTTVYATEFKRTQQTAEPVVRSVGIPVTIVPAEETKTLISKLKKSRGNSLVVGHSNTLPEIIKALGVRPSVVIGETDYDNLFVVVRGSSSQLIRLHYR